MFNKVVLRILIALFSLSAFAQKTINNYKYILVPKQFEFSKADDEFQLNSLTNFLFNKYGYTSYFTDDILPEDLNSNRCLALMVGVSNKKSGIFKTKIEITLKDCYNNQIAISKVGESRLKKFDRAYNEALREAFETFKNFDYNYKQSSPEVVIDSDDIEEPETSNQAEKKVEITKELFLKNEEEKSTDKYEKQLVNEEVIKQILYAQTINDGYQLVDSKPEIIMVLINTSAKDIFMVKNKNAIVYKEKNDWIYFENTNGEIIQYFIKIKF